MEAMSIVSRGNKRDYKNSRKLIKTTEKSTETATLDRSGWLDGF